MTCQGTSETVEISPNDTTTPPANAAANAIAERSRVACKCVRIIQAWDAIATIAADAARPINNCSQALVPTAGINIRLNASAPPMEPAVLAAYISPESRAGSSPSAAALAIANGKLAPHSSVGRKIVRIERKTSRSKLNHGLSDSHGSTGQNGSTCVTMYAVPAIDAARRIWQPPSANRGWPMCRTNNEPAPLPSHSPIRKTARMMENV